MSRLLDEGIDDGSGPRPMSTRRETVRMLPDGASDPTCSTNLSRSTTIRDNDILESPKKITTESPVAPGARCQAPMLRPSSRRAPLQQSFKPIQPTNLTYDIPGTGGGKENMPPGMSDQVQTTGKSIGGSVYQKSSRTENAIAPTNTRTRSRATYKKPPPQAEMIEYETQGSAPKPYLHTTPSFNPVSIPPDLRTSFQVSPSLPSVSVTTIAIETFRAYWMLIGYAESKSQVSPSAMTLPPKAAPAVAGSSDIELISTASSTLLPQASVSKRDRSAMVVESLRHTGQKENKSAADKDKVAWATGVIARWWRGVKSSKKKDQKPRRKVARRSAGQSRGRLGIRRL